MLGLHILATTTPSLARLRAEGGADVAGIVMGTFVCNVQLLTVGVEKTFEKVRGGFAEVLMFVRGVLFV